METAIIAKIAVDSSGALLRIAKYEEKIMSVIDVRRYPIKNKMMAINKKE